MKKVIIVLILFFGGCFLIERYHQSKRQRANAFSNDLKSSEEAYQTVIDSTMETTCDECGHRFTGRGFTEVSEAVWEETTEPYQSSICSYSCGLKHTGKWDAYLEDLRSRHSSNDEVSGYSAGSDGRVYENSACELCNGTGVEVATAANPATGVVERRICPVCEGRGVQSY